MTDAPSASIGAALKEARSKRSVTLEDAHARLKIHPRVLQLLEEDKFDKSNERNPQPGSEDGTWKKYTLVTLTPRTEALKRDIRRVRVTLTPETFLPLSIMIEKRNDSHITVTFSDHQINPTPEPDEKFFDLGTDGYTVKHPQKED